MKPQAPSETSKSVSTKIALLIHSRKTDSGAAGVVGGFVNGLGRRKAFALFTLFASCSLFAQWGGEQTRTANIRGGGGDGKCTIEVEVDNVAEVEDFCVRIEGARTYESLRSRATLVPFGDKQLLVASMADIIKSKRAAGRPKDLAIPVTLEEVYAKIQAREKAKAPEPKKAV